jgi:copper(I)-binding protein
MNLIFKGCLAALLLTSLSLAHAGPPEFSSARIIQPPPGAMVAAAYFTVLNTSDQPLVITGASSEAVPNVSIHLSTIIDDVAKMIHQDSVTIEAGSSLEFKHGSYHLMLMGLKAPLTPGSMLAFEIDTSAGVVPIMIPIITPDEASSMKHDDMDASKSMDKN